ncbi:MAG: TolC family protein [Kofleriaceae bacterium]
MTSIFRTSLHVALGLALLGGPALAQPTPSPERPATGGGARETITLERAVEIAMQQQPQLRQNVAAVEAAQGRIDQAKVTLRPTVSLNGSVAVGSSPQRPCADDLSRVCAGFFDPATSTALSAQASWRIYDFGQTAANVRAAELNAEATAAAVDTAVLDVRTRVEVAYLEAVARQRLVGVAEATVQSEDLHLEQARKFVAAQAKDPIEVAQAQARAANARSSLAQAQSSNAIALANLRAAIGWLDAARSPVPDPTWPVPPQQEPPALVSLVEAARSERPEIAQLDKQIAAAGASLDAAIAQRRPVLSATASTQWAPNSQDWGRDPTWTAGLSLQWNLFDGGRSQADRRVARANVTSAQAQRDALLVSLTSELELSRAQIDANRGNVAASQEAVTAARAQLQLAEARYAQGLGSQIELTDAQFAVTTAEGNLVTAEWQLANAWTQLRRALGQR